MATAQANKKVYVSPGVYTSETDLSFVAQSVGVTTLGVVGETLKGPAFEPIFITNYDEFQAYFGGTEPVKFVNTQIPKYEAAYIAKSYLQQSNQLFVTRVLGLSGYDAGPSWSISVTANVDPLTIAFSPSSAGTVFTASFTGSNSANTVTVNTSALPVEIQNDYTTQYRLSDGSTSTYEADFNTYLSGIWDTSCSSGTTCVVYGSIPSSDWSSLTGNYPVLNNVFGVPGDCDYDYNDLSSGSNDSWYYGTFNNYTADNYSGYSFDYVVSSLSSGATSDAFVGTISGTIYTFSGFAYTEFNNMVVATLRSRGICEYTNNASSPNHGPIYQVTGLTDLQLVTNGSYSGVTKDPYGTFLISGITKGDFNTGQRTTFQLETSLLASSSKYLTKVLGVDNFGKDRFTVPVFVEESYQASLNIAYQKGYIRGLNTTLIDLPGARSENNTSIAYSLERYQSPETPFLVSELRGNEVYNLFKFISISDGDAANMEVKVSIANLSFNNMSFDVLVRNFYDTDTNPVVIEKFTNCNMDPNDNAFIAKKIGTIDGEYELNSKYVMIELNEDAPIDALPCGFLGFNFREYAGVRPPFPIIKQKYDFPGEVIYNPPFGLSSGADDITRSNGDNVRRTYLGISDTIGIDVDYYYYKGKQLPLDICGDSTGEDWNFRSRGFHMDIDASGITIPNAFVTSGTPAFYCGSAPFTKDPDTESNPYYRIFARKFSFLVQGGFDGWDIYREHRTNSDRFVLGRNGYLKGSCPSIKYPTATGWGAFKQITVGDNTQGYANTDYYAYLLGQKTFVNPEAVNINLFVTPGIDYVNHSNLVESAVDMIENDRADSLYVCTTPDFNMFVPTTTNTQDLIYPQEAVDNLDTAGIDSNYTATYYPWVLTRDTVNNTQIYLPATAEVTRNLALTDNIAFPWFAAAGYTRGIVNAIKARKKLTQEDRDTLYQGRLNPIATFSDVGTVIWGNKTLQVRQSALDRINVRRLLLQARKLISAVSVRLLFEQNDQKVRQDFLDAVNPILDAIRRDRGLYDFRVTVSSDVADLDRNQMTGKIYVKPTKSLEFIDITFYITPTGASFENI